MRYRPSWRIRRRVIFATLAFCAFWLGWIIVGAAPDSRLHETIALGLLGLAASVIGSYVFGAAWEDRAAIQAEAAVPTKEIE